MEYEHAPYNFYWDFEEWKPDFVVKVEKAERIYKLSQKIFMLLVEREPHHGFGVDYAKMAKLATTIARGFVTTAYETI